MNLQQFRYVQEAVRRNLNLTETARALQTSQPGVSKAIIELEEELGVEIFARRGKRLKRVTEPGQHVLKSIDLILRELGNMRRIGQQFATEASGTLRIAATHTQARYVLPVVLAKLRTALPKVDVCLFQGSPDEVARMVLDETAEVGIATEALTSVDELVTLPCGEWQHMVVLPPLHPLAGRSDITLEELAREPLLTYQPAYAGRGRIDAAFAARRLQPRIALQAIDSDVIKTYVRQGLGVGIVAEMALAGEAGEADLVAWPAGRFFGVNETQLAFKRGVYLRGFIYTFAALLNEQLAREAIDRAMSGAALDAAASATVSFR